MDLQMTEAKGEVSRREARRGSIRLRRGKHRGEREVLRALFDKARGRLFRAASDALDGAGISYKFRIPDAMEGISNDRVATEKSKARFHLEDRYPD